MFLFHIIGAVAVHYIFSLRKAAGTLPMRVILFYTKPRMESKIGWFQYPVHDGLYIYISFQKIPLPKCFNFILSFGGCADLSEFPS